MELMNKKLCIYHGNCADGFAGAWVVRKYYGEENIDFVAGVYQTPPPDVTGKDVILVDFSYKRDIVLEMAKTAASIIIIDHHKSAIEDLTTIYSRNIKLYTDINHSGSMLAWKLFFGAIEAPPLLKYIEDRDLWKFYLPGTREIQAALFSYPYDFGIYDELMQSSNCNTLYNEGISIERKHFKDINELLKVSTRPMCIGGHKVQVANLPYTMSSDAAHMLAKNYPFGACYYDKPEGRYFSLRSQETGIDVSEIAIKYGGGGHKHAAAFTISFAQAAEFEC